MSKIHHLTLSIILALVLTAFFLLVLPAQGRLLASPEAAIVVNTLQDEDNHDGDCALREAIRAANENTQVDECPVGDGVITDTITFSTNGTITLTKVLTVTAGGSLLVDGAGEIKISGNDRVPIFFVDIDTDLMLESLSIVQGRGFEGGSIYNAGFLTITNSLLSSNNADYGGAIFNAGALTIANSSLSENSAGLLGGGIYNVGSLILTNSSLTDNRITGDSPAVFQGGGVYNHAAGVVSIMDSTLSSNNVTGDYSGSTYGGGGIASYGKLSITSSTLSENIAEEGGGIFNGGVLTITYTTLSGNSAYYGGGISNADTLTITSSTLSGNSGGEGGGVYNSFGTMYMINTTLSGNSAGSGGGIHNDAALTVTNSTLAENSAEYLGGGIYVDTWASLSLSGSIVSGNHASSNRNCAGISTTIDVGYNIEDDVTCHLETVKGSLPNTDPLLGPLQDNGGPTWTHALLYNSPAIDAGDPLNCPPNDQRWVTRPLDGDADGAAICDMGAYEFDPRIELQPANSFDFNLLGTTIEYALELHNDTTLTDTYTLTLGPHAWETFLSTDTLGPLSGSESQPFTVAVSIPLTATAFTTDTVIVTATSDTQPTLYFTTAKVSTMAVEEIFRISLPLVAGRE